MLEILLKGILIGIIVSAPMGPIGMMCVRRTMKFGKRYGMLTGLGATVSDLIYAAVTLLGVGAFIDFIVKHSSYLQLVGSLFVIAFAMYVMFSNHSIEQVHRYKKHEAKKRKAQQQSKVCINNETPKNDLQVFLSAFLLTFSNLLIVLLYIGLFAQFSFITSEATIYHLFAGLLGIGIGAVSWWYIVTTALVKVKEWFNVSSLKYFNRGVGGLLCFFGIMGILNALVELF